MKNELRLPAINKILQSSPVEEAEPDVKINAQEHHTQCYSTNAPQFSDR